MHHSVTEIVHGLVRPHLRPGDAALDGTAGNGHDALFLARCVGPTGRVFAWDIQPLALARTAARLACNGVTWVELILGCHTGIETRPAPPFAATLFNLGYLPASDRTVATAAATSARAVRAAAARLAPGGILAVLAYTAHAGGRDEAAAIHDLLRSLPPGAGTVHEEVFAPGRSAPPRLFTLRRPGGRGG